MTILITVPGLLEPSNKALALQASAIQLSTVKITDQSGYDRVASSLRDVATIQTQMSARTMALDPATHRIFLAAAGLGATPAATPEQPNPRPGVVPDSFVILVAEPK